jgi:hypothetical protein
MANTSSQNMLSNFMQKMQLFQFAPPSDNIWTVSIEVASARGSNLTDKDELGTSIGTLNNGIIAANKLWSQKTATRWAINVGKLSLNDKFFSNFADLPEIFLASDVSFTPIENQIESNIFTQANQYGSFYNFGHIGMSRPNNRNLNIRFLVSNWDIGDILFDPWIAAVAQKGLIEDFQSSIKANITIKEYTAVKPVYIHNTDDVVRNLKYNPEKGVNEKLAHVYGQMECKKQYKFFNCVPIKRGEISKNYEPNDAGTFKKSIVNFVFDDYKIEYLK